jgi:hypothetical protein
MNKVALAVAVVGGLLASGAFADERNATWEAQVAQNTDVELRNNLDTMRYMDQHPEARTVDYYKCFTDDGYGRKQPCDGIDNGGASSGP